MSNLIFPTLPGLALGVIKTPAFATHIQEATSGFEVRSSKRLNPMWRFSLTFDYLNGKRVTGTSQLEKLVGFFTAHRGSFDSFLYSDPSDNAVTDGVFAQGDGTTKVFQLVRVFGGVAEPVTNISAVLNIKIAGVLKTLGTDYSVSSLGVVTFITSPASGAALTWSGSYYYRARFSSDTLDFQNEIANIWTAKKVDLLATLGARL